MMRAISSERIRIYIVVHTAASSQGTLVSTTPSPVLQSGLLIPTTGFQDRRNAIAARLVDAKLDGLLVTHLPNVRYLTGFTGSNALLLLSPSRSTLLTDPRYDIQSREETDCQVSICKKSIWKMIPSLLARRRWKTIGIEASHLTVDVSQTLQSALPLGATLHPVPAWIETARTVKSPSEIGLIRQSVRTCSAAFAQTLKSLRPGLREIEVAAELDYHMRRLGADGPAFETIVAAGVRSALPHARPTSAIVQPDQLLLIDMGASQQGYASDMTRTVCAGKPAPKVRRTYSAVLEAQLAAVAAVRPGATAGSVDRAARRILRAHGLDNAFVHSTGHGLGLEIHEAPRLGRGDNTVLCEGMVVTVEPGVYIEGFGGIRIEDTVLVSGAGCEVLTPTNKELLAL